MNSNLCQHLPWDSSFFGRKIARVQPTTVNKNRIEEALHWSATERVDCLYFLCDTADPASASLAESHGFNMMDVKVTKEFSIASVTDRSNFSGTADVRRAISRDVPTLKTIAKVSHRDSRFYADQHFDRLRCAALYETWIEKSCNGWADIVFVACVDEEAVGYISCHQDQPGLGHIGLAAVASRAQGHGLGKSLVYESLSWFANHDAAKVTVVTQGRNVSAQRLYESCGFLTRNVQLWYHRWAPFSVG